MKIDPDRLRSLRKKQKLSLVKLAEKTRRVNPPGITEKTIQRLEAPSQQNTTVREHTIESLVKALNVEPGVLTGDLPLPESDDTPADNPDRVQIGAQIAPKTRLAYDLIKRRYGVNVTEIINMAPLFFTLLAEGSLAWRQEKLKEVEEAYDHLMQIDGFWSGGGAYIEHGMNEGTFVEEESIDKADLFGEHLDD
ncbi:MAG: helix-turn-helix transcriptional regulator, partial [Gemmatimonadota bacterium]|nr:helix-turn-helix transcriptional regulator [Gemmatimonadota bacterium]